MATRYWIGSSANWNVTSSWATTSGGAGPASVPTAADDVIFDAASPGPCTISATAVCRSLDATNYPYVITQSANLSVGTSTANGTLAFKLGSAVGWNWTAGTISFISTSGTQVQVTTAGVAMGGGNCTFSGAGGSWLITDGWYCNGALTHTNGTLNFGPNSVIQSVTFATTGTNTRALTIGAGASVYLSPSTTASWTASGSGLTLTADSSSQIVINSSTVTFAGGGYTYGWLTFPNAATYVATITGSNTFRGINNNGYASMTFTTATTQTITQADGWMVTGDNQATAPIIKSSTTTFTLSCPSGQVVSRNIALKGCTATGGATFYAGSTSTNTSGNTGWSFTDPTTGISRVPGYPTYLSGAFGTSGIGGAGMDIPGGAIGDLLVATVCVDLDTAVVISGGGVTTWHQATRITVASGATSQMVLWWGIVTSTGPQTIVTNYTIPGGDNGPDLTADCYHAPSATWGYTSAGATSSTTDTTVKFAALTPSAAADNVYVGVGNVGGAFSGYGACPGFTENAIGSYPFLFASNLHAPAGLPIAPTFANNTGGWRTVAGVFTPEWVAPAATPYIDWI